MLTLGDLLGQARAAAPAFERWLDNVAPQLADQLRAAAFAQGESAGQFARAAVAAFDRDADAEAWTRLTGRLHQAADPGLACLAEIVRWRLVAQGVQSMKEA